MPPDWRRLTVERQLDDPASTLSFFCDILRLRRNAFHFAANDVEWLESGPSVLAFVSGGVLCVVNTGGSAVKLPDGEVLIANAPLSGGKLPPDSAVWLATR